MSLVLYMKGYHQPKRHLPIYLSIYLSTYTYIGFLIAYFYLGSSIMFFGIYPNSWEIYVPTKACLLAASFFIITKTWKEARCLSVSERISKFWYMETMECYSALKRNELSNIWNIWRNSKCILLCENIQSEKVEYCMIPFIWYFGKGISVETAMVASG